MRILLICLFFLLAGCAETEQLALERESTVSEEFQDYGDAAQYLSAKSGVIAICRAALEIDNGSLTGFETGRCGRVLKSSDHIRDAVLMWLNATESEQKRWFERYPYEYRDMLNAIKDYDRIVQFVSNSDYSGQ